MGAPSSARLAGMGERVLVFAVCSRRKGPYYMQPTCRRRGIEAGDRLEWEHLGGGTLWLKKRV